MEIPSSTPNSFSFPPQKRPEFQTWEKFLQDPLNFPRHILKIPDAWIWWGAQKIIRSAFSHRRTAVQSGNSMSKDWSGGIITLAWLIKHWGNAKVICIAPKFEQVKEIMFAEIGKQYRRLQERFPTFRDDWLSSHKLTFGPDCYALGMTSKDTKGMIGKLAGFKSPNLLIIVSEAQAVESSVFKQLIGLMTAPNNHVIELGNPLVCFGDFYEHCTQPRFGYNVIQLRGDDSPNIIAGREVIPGVMSVEFREDLRQQCGLSYEDDPEYQARYHGEFPQQSQYAWIPLLKIKQAVGRKFQNDDDLIVGGLDVAREGADETVHTVLKGRTQISQDTFRKVLTPDTVGWALGLIDDHKMKAMGIDIGYNPGTYDWLNTSPLTARTNLMAINFGGKSPLEKFENLGTFMWWLLREAFLHDEISIIDDPILVSQLSSRRVMRTPKGKIKLEPKKKSLVQVTPSPDRADALALAWYARINMSAWGESISDTSGQSSAAALDELIEKVAVSDVEISEADTLSGAPDLDDDFASGGENDASQLERFS